MKLFLKILFFTFTMIIITVGETKSSTVATILREKTSYSFIQKLQLVNIFFENHNANSCLNERNGVTYCERVISVEGRVAKGGIVTHIVEADFNVLKSATTVVRANGERAINNVTTLVNNKQALVIKPIENSSLASKMDDYISAFKGGNTARQGEIGEEMAEMLAKEVDNTTVLNIKLNNSGNGFDVMQFENGLENTTKIRLFESKPMNNNSVVLPNTANMGTQMGDQWTRANILKMVNNPNADIANIGNILFQNQSQIERYVFTVDKDLKQVIIFKLDNFK